MLGSFLIKFLSKLILQLFLSKQIPALNSKKLRGTDGRRIRIGDYRILYRIDDANHIVTIYRIRHRREAYR